MKRSGLLPRRQGLPRRSAPLRPESLAHARQRRTQGRAYAGAADAGQGACSCCQRELPLEHSHLLTQKQYPQHRDNPLNWLLKCADCHRLFEHNKRRFARAFPAVWRLIQDRIWLVGGPEALAFFQLKNPY